MSQANVEPRAIAEAVFGAILDFRGGAERGALLFRMAGMLSGVPVEQTMWQADLSGGAVLVFGAEGKGLRPLVRKACDAAVSIPLLGRVESLNVSVAASLLLYEARRRRG